jgi:hypothetical protein
MCSFAAPRFRLRYLMSFVALTGCWMAALRAWPLEARVALVISLLPLGMMGVFAADPYPETAQARRMVESCKRHLVVGLWFFSTGLAALVSVVLIQRLAIPEAK